MHFEQGAVLGHHLACKMAALGVNKSTGVAVALSGGADSLSLALAVSWWSGANGNIPSEVCRAMGQVPPAKPRSLIQHLTASQYLQHLLKPAKAQQLELHSPRQQPSVVALCVDHALRSASHSECQNASSQAAAMGMESHVMQMQWPEKPRSGHLMEQASITRYKLLHLACKARQISVLLTGHHAGDQAENFMMRASRGSGIAGLSSIAEASWSSLDTDYPLLLVRPFLEVPKWKLEAACTEQALTWADDPTNRDTKYLRNHMRSLLSKTITHAQSQLPLSGFAPRSQPADAHRQQFVDKAMHVPEEEHQVSSQASQGEGQLDAAEQQLGEVNIIPAILRVHSRCAAAHYTVSSQVKDLLQASLNLSRQTDQQQKRRKRHEPGHQTGTEWSLAVKPFAEAQPAVALHALTAVMQAVSVRHKQPRLSVVQKLLSMLVTGKLRGSFVANDCIFSPVTFSKGQYMKVQQQMPAIGADARLPTATRLQ